MRQIKMFALVAIIAVAATLSANAYYPRLFGLISETTTSAPAYNEQLATILDRVRIPTDVATKLGIPAGDFDVREWRYWYDPANHAIVLEILKKYGSITDWSPNPDVSGRTDLPRPSDEFVFSRFDMNQYSSAGYFVTVRDDFGNVLEFAVPFSASSIFDCPNVWAKLNGFNIGLSVKTFTTDVLTCDFLVDSSPTPTPTPVPTADIKANGSDGPITVSKNSSVTLSWTSNNVTFCSVSPGGWTGTSNTGISTGKLMSAKTFKLSCSGNYGDTSDFVKIMIKK